MKPSLSAELAKCEAAAALPWRIRPYVDGIDIVDADDRLVVNLYDRPVGPIGQPPDNAVLIRSAVNQHYTAHLLLQRIRSHCRSSDVMFGQIAAMIDAEFCP